MVETRQSTIRQGIQKLISFYTLSFDNNDYSRRAMNLQLRIFYLMLKAGNTSTRKDLRKSYQLRELLDAVLHSGDSSPDGVGS